MGPVSKSNIGVEHPVFKMSEGQCHQACEDLPWCSVHKPWSEKPSAGLGRTAICVTGQPRSLFTKPSDMSHPDSISGKYYLRNQRWAGPRRKRYPNNLIATSWQNNIYAPLATFGGFDVFVIKQGPTRDAQGNILPPRQPTEGNGGYDAIEPDSVNWQGEPNRMIVYQKGEDASESSAMASDLLLCDELVRVHSRDNGTVYMYGMRLRADYAIAAPIPPLHTIDFGTHAAPLLRTSKATTADNGGSHDDAFAIGKVVAMNRSNAKLQAHPGFETVVFSHAKNHTHGQRAHVDHTSRHPESSSQQLCESRPWCSVHKPWSEKPSAGLGRTAICVTGQPRSLFTKPSDMSHPDSISGKYYLRNQRWAGPRRKRYPNNLIATSWQNNIYAPLATFGGFDVFVIKQGPTRDAQGNILPPRQPTEGNGGYDAIEPDSVNWQGEPNRMIVYQKGEEYSLPVNDSSSTWRAYYMAIKYRNYPRFQYLRGVYTQSALWMVYDQLLCNELIRKHSRETGKEYAYKMRLRTDYAAVAPIPPLHTVDFGPDTASLVFINTATIYSGGNEDGFGVGRVKLMDVYLDRYARQNTWQPSYIWTTESFLWDHLRNVSNGTLRAHKGFAFVILRVQNHTRGPTQIPANSNLREWLYNIQHNNHAPTCRPVGYPRNATQPVMSGGAIANATYIAPGMETYAAHYAHVCREPGVRCPSD